MAVAPKALVSALFVALAGAVLADEVVLKDGRVLKTTKPYTVKGSTAILTLTDKSVVSVKVSEIDKAQTAARKSAAAAPTPAAPATPDRARTAADAVRMKAPSRKATVVLTDQDVAPGTEEVTGDEGGALVQMGPVTPTQIEGGGVKFEGSVQNVGKVDALAVSVTIELIGDENKTITSTYGSLAKDTLTPGEKTSFTASVPVPPGTKVVNFRYVPSWREKSGAAAPQAEEAKEETTAASAPKATPPPAAAPPPSRPDVAAPSPNAPVGQPSQPGGAYLPQPSAEGQPKPPGGGV